MSIPVIRIAGPADGPALAALRRAWTVQNSDDDPGRGDGAGHGDGPAGPAAARDDGFEDRFADWYQRESARRISWLAEVAGHPVGMMHLAIFERMPAPGRDPGTWGYLANAFVLAPYRSQGIGGLLLAALLAHADRHAYVRVVLRPCDRAVPFYTRAGFTASDHSSSAPARTLRSASRHSSGTARLRIRATIRSASSAPIGANLFSRSPRSCS